MTDVGYVGGGYNDEVGQARSVCLNHLSLFIKFKIIPPKEKPPSNTPTAIGSGGTRTPATSLGNAGGSRKKPSAKIKFKMRIVSRCQCITRTPDQDPSDFSPENDLLDFEESGFKSNEIDKECDSDGFREMRVNISEMVGLCQKPGDEGQAWTGANVPIPCKCNDEMTCEFEADASKFVTEPRLADGDPLNGPLLDDVGKALELAAGCQGECEPTWLYDAKELWISPVPACSNCLVEKGLGCDSNAEAVRLVMNASKMKGVPEIVQTMAFNQCMKPDCPREGEETSLDQACEFIKLYMKG
jgi:hypothetical protein